MPLKARAYWALPQQRAQGPFRRGCRKFLAATGPAAAWDLRIVTAPELPTTSSQLPRAARTARNRQGNTFSLCLELDGSVLFKPYLWHGLGSSASRFFFTQDAVQRGPRLCALSARRCRNPAAIRPTPRRPPEPIWDGTGMKWA